MTLSKFSYQNRFAVFQTALCLVSVVLTIVFGIVPLEVDLQKVVLPVIRLIFSSDGIIDPRTVVLLANGLAKIKYLLLAGSVGVAFFVGIWRFFPADRAGSPEFAPNRRPVSGYEWAGIFVVMLVGLWVRVPGLFRELIYDEVFTLAHFIQKKTFWEAITSQNVFNNHIGFTALAWISTHLFGTAEWALRLPALLMGMGSLFLLWGAARNLVGPAHALGATFLMSLWPVHVFYSVTGRGYTGMIFFSILSTWLFFRLLLDPDRKYGAGYVIANFFGILFHFCFIFVLMVQGLLFAGLSLYQTVVQEKKTVLTKRCFHGLWICFFLTCLSGLFYFLLNPRFLLAVLGMERSSAAVSFIFPVRVVEFLMDGLNDYGIAVFSVFLAGLFSFPEKQRLWPVYIAALLAVPPAVLMMMRTEFLCPRYFVFNVPFFLLAFSGGLKRLWAAGGLFSAPALRKIFLFFVGLIGVAGTVSLAGRASALSGQKAGFQEAVLFVGSKIDEGTGVCAIGDIAPIFADYAQYYAKYPVSLPESEKEFEQLRSSHRTIYCFQDNHRDMSVEHGKIHNNLSANGARFRFGDVDVFRVPRPGLLSH